MLQVGEKRKEMVKKAPERNEDVDTGGGGRKRNVLRCAVTEPIKQVPLI